MLTVRSFVSTHSLNCAALIVITGLLLAATGAADEKAARSGHRTFTLKDQPVRSQAGPQVSPLPEQAITAKPDKPSVTYILSRTPPVWECSPATPNFLPRILVNARSGRL
ncbi:MAG: hypothetical protein HY902_18105 [Deltaproteobacteria bacterium]|nr:hypothetical protein [Deltaproteobacteria bacterium]